MTETTATPIEAQAEVEATPIPQAPQKRFSFKLGADPEYLIFHGARAIDASQVIKSFFSKSEKVNAIGDGPHGNTQYEIPDKGVIGWDGAASTGELRPLPSNDPKVIVENLQALIGTLVDGMPSMDYTTLSIGSPIGGHIHLECPEDLENEFKDGTTEGEKKKQRMTKLITSFIMPIIASEHRISSNSRISMNYGKADDIRVGPAGDKNDNPYTFEIRGMSAEWLTTPKIAYATLAYMGVVWHEILKRDKELIKEKNTLKTKAQINAMHQLMLADFKPVEVAVLKTLAKSLKTFELYPMFKEEVDYILHPSQVLEDKEKAGWNLTAGWNVGKNMKNPTKKELLSTKKVSEELKGQDLVAINQSFQVPYNDDYNVSLFAQAISDRIAALNWKHKNEYFLYGLKKGVEGFAAMRVTENKFYTIPKNQEKADTLKSATRMAQRFMQEIARTVRIDPKTGKTRRPGTNQVVIGVPYGIRAENNTKPLISLIWDIEQEKIPLKSIDAFAVTMNKETPDDVDKEQIIGNAMKGDNTIRNQNGDTLTIIDQDDTWNDNPRHNDDDDEEDEDEL